MVDELLAKAQKSKQASRRLARLSTEVKNRALLGIAGALTDRMDEVLAANEQDYTAAKAEGMDAAMLDRLLLNASRLKGMAEDVRRIAELPDPIGETFETRTLPNGLQLSKRRVPIGVLGAIYESRPNVTVDIASLCLKSGNAVILRGGKEAIHSNSALARLVADAATAAGVPEGAVQLIEDTDRALVGRMLKLREYIDLMIPRGGSGLIRFVAENAAMAVVTGGIGVCHTYVDRTADPAKAEAIAYNAKVQRPTVCNALDTLLVHVDAAPDVLPRVARAWAKAGVEVRCDERALALLQPLAEGREGAPPVVRPATDADWGTEFLSLVASVKVVDSIDEALAHIDRYGSGHSEAIVTGDDAAAARFLDEVDAACVYVNASTRFTDGSQFGLGAEVGISTQKLHARGPMGLQELTIYKWLVVGNGQVRP